MFSSKQRRPTGGFSVKDALILVLAFVTFAAWLFVGLYAWIPTVTLLLLVYRENVRRRRLQREKQAPDQKERKKCTSELL
jgi:hypothetical protein